MFNMENFLHFFEFLHVPFKYKMIFLFQYFKDTLSILIVYKPGGGKQLLEVSPNYVKEKIEGISKTKV